MDLESRNPPLLCPPRSGHPGGDDRGCPPQHRSRADARRRRPARRRDHAAHGGGARCHRGHRQGGAGCGGRRRHGGRGRARSREVVDAGAKLIVTPGTPVTLAEALAEAPDPGDAGLRHRLGGDDPRGAGLRGAEVFPRRGLRRRGLAQGDRGPAAAPRASARPAASTCRTRRPISPCRTSPASAAPGSPQRRPSRSGDFASIDRLAREAAALQGLIPARSRGCEPTRALVVLTFRCALGDVMFDANANCSMRLCAVAAQACEEADDVRNRHEAAGQLRSAHGIGRIAEAGATGRSPPVDQAARRDGPELRHGA